MSAFDAGRLTDAWSHNRLIVCGEQTRLPAWDSDGVLQSVYNVYSFGEPTELLIIDQDDDIQNLIRNQADRQPEPPSGFFETFYNILTIFELPVCFLYRKFKYLKGLKLP